MRNSKIDNSVSFLGFKDNANPIRSFYITRKANLKRTFIIWITKKPKYDKYLGEMYNPKTPILVFLN